MPRLPVFCQFCGHNNLTPIVEETAFRCEACHRFIYLNSKPSACAIIIRDKEVLLVTDGQPPASWDLPGGFLLNGEAPEDGLRRELREELNAEVLVGGIVTAMIDTYGDDTDFCLNLFYEVKLVCDSLVAGAETKAYGWFSPNDLPIIKHKSTLRILQDIEESLREGPPG